MPVAQPRRAAGRSGRASQRRAARIRGVEPGPHTIYRLHRPAGVVIALKRGVEERRWFGAGAAGRGVVSISRPCAAIASPTSKGACSARARIASNPLRRRAAMPSDMPHRSVPQAFRLSSSAAAAAGDRNRPIDRQPCSKWQTGRYCCASSASLSPSRQRTNSSRPGNILPSALSMRPYTGRSVLLSFFVFVMIPRRSLTEL